MAHALTKRSTNSCITAADAKQVTNSSGIATNAASSENTVQPESSRIKERQRAESSPLPEVPTSSSQKSERPPVLVAEEENFGHSIGTLGRKSLDQPQPKRPRKSCTQPRGLLNMSKEEGAERRRLLARIKQVRVNADSKARTLRESASLQAGPSLPSVSKNTGSNAPSTVPQAGQTSSQASQRAEIGKQASKSSQSDSLADPGRLKHDPCYRDVLADIACLAHGQWQ